jgi:hypothetical protein
MPMLSEGYLLWRLRTPGGAFLRAVFAVWVGALSVSGLHAWLDAGNPEGWTKLVPLRIEALATVALFLAKAAPVVLVAASLLFWVFQVLRRRVEASAQASMSRLKLAVVIWAMVQLPPACLLYVAISEFGYRGCDTIAFDSFHYTADCADTWTVSLIAGTAWLFTLAGLGLWLWRATR